MAIIWTTIWLDLMIDRNISLHRALCKAAPYLITFRDLEPCIDYITDLNVNDNRVVLIISNDTPLQIDILLRLCDEVAQIHSVYVPSTNDTNRVNTLKIASKLHETFDDFQTTLDGLRQIPNIDRRRRDGFLQNDFAIKSLNQEVNSSAHASHTTNTAVTNNNFQTLPTSIATTTTHQEAEFMYSSLLRDILVEAESSRGEMLDFCREKYDNDEVALGYINEFQEYYDSRNAVFWYTRDTFLYRLLNQALRTQHAGTLYSLRHFIKDLHLQLKDRYIADQSNASESNFEIIYRGQLMDAKEFNKKIRNNIGGFFSVNTFLSATLLRELAITYAGTSSNDENSMIQSILFQITIDKNVNKFPYANISSESAFGDAESEILFTMGAVFRITSVTLNAAEGYWIVHLNLTGEEDEELNTLAKYIREEIMGTTWLSSFANLMLKLDKYNEAKQYYIKLLKQTKSSASPLELSYIYNQLGSINNAIRDPKKALKYIEKSLKIKREHLDEDDPAFAVTYNNLGSNYYSQRRHQDALSYFTDALEANQSGPDENQSETATSYDNIGLVYKAQKHYKEALGMHKRALEIRFEILPVNHPDIATSYNHIAEVYFATGKYRIAHQCYQKAQKIKQRSLPSNNRSLAKTSKHMTTALSKQCSLEKTVQQMSIFDQIDSTNFSSDDSDISEDLGNVKSRLRRRLRPMKRR